MNIRSRRPLSLSNLRAFEAVARLLSFNAAADELQRRLGRASPDDFREANRRYAAITARLVGNPPATDALPARTLRSWLARPAAA